MKVTNWYLNITELPTLSEETKKYIEGLKEYKASQWNLQTNEMKKFKLELLDGLLKIQENRCVYCGKCLDLCSIDREHFGHKAQLDGYPEFMFLLENLFAACEYCNRRLKESFDVIGKYHKDYLKCEFLIIHPYYDDPSTFIEYVPSIENPIKVFPTLDDCGKGANTIKLFDLSSKEQWISRAMFLHAMSMDKSQYDDIQSYPRTRIK